mmetsp:Transcript_78238/g.123500  ORF Transcript_78238/g.123500 Transcript_78238/m.123500 type:complete len:251 (-) Transcript_78238:44-796(-)
MLWLKCCIRYFLLLLLDSQRLRMSQCNKTEDVVRSLNRALVELEGKGYDLPSIAFSIADSRKFVTRVRSLGTSFVESSDQAEYDSSAIRVSFVSEEKLIKTYNDLVEDADSVTLNAAMKIAWSGDFSLSGKTTLLAFFWQLMQGPPTAQQHFTTEGKGAQQAATFRPAPKRKQIDASQCETSLWPSSGTLLLCGALTVLAATFSYCAVASGTVKLACAVVPLMPSLDDQEKVEEKQAGGCTCSEEVYELE